LKLGSSSNDRAAGGHASAHFLQRLQNSTTPKSTGWSQFIGKLVDVVLRPVVHGKPGEADGSGVDDGR
jgi:hypothetical protein